MGNQRLHRHAEQRSREARQDGGHRQGGKIDGARAADRHPHGSECAQHRTDHVPALGAQRHVDDRRPEELPGLRHDVERDQSSDTLGRHPGLCELIRDRDGQVAIDGAERKVQSCIDARMNGGVRWH